MLGRHWDYTIKIKMFDGIMRVIGGVRHVQDLKNNLFSLGILLDDLVYTYSSNIGIMKITKICLGGKTGQNIDKLYRLVGNTVVGGFTVNNLHRLTVTNVGFL